MAAPRKTKAPAVNAGAPSGDAAPVAEAVDVAAAAPAMGVQAIIPQATAMLMFNGVLITLRPGVKAFLEPGTIAQLDQSGTPYTRA